MGAVSVGLYVGTEKTDLVVLGGSFQHPRLVYSASSPLPTEGPWRNQLRTEEGAPAPAPGQASGTPEIDAGVLQTLQTLIRAAGLSSSRAHIAISSEAFIIRYFQMPTVPLRERRQAVAFEAKKYLPFKMEELISDQQVVIHRKDPSLMRVMFFGIKKTTAAVVLFLFRTLGLTPLSLETTPISLMRLLRQTGQLSPGQVAAILTTERDMATITIAHPGLLYLSRNITIPAAPGATPSSGELFEALITETRVSIDYYRRRFLGEPGVGKVILFGKDLDPKQIQDLGSALDVPVEPGNLLQRTMMGSRGLSGGLATAAGLALRGLERKSSEPNLLPPEYRRNLQGVARPVAVEATAALILLTAWYAAAWSDLHHLEQKAEAIRASQIKPQGIPATRSISELKTVGEEQQKQLQFLQDLSKSRSNASALLSELSRLVPEESWVQHATLEETSKKPEPGRFPEPQRTFKLSGAAYLNNREQELEGVNQFLSSLKTNRLFGAAFNEFTLDNVYRDQFHHEEITRFQLTCATSKEKK